MQGNRARDTKPELIARRLVAHSGTGTMRLYGDPFANARGGPDVTRVVSGELEVRRCCTRSARIPAPWSTWPSRRVEDTVSPAACGYGLEVSRHDPPPRPHRRSLCPQASGLHEPRKRGAWRDEEKSRAKERVFSFRSTGQVWDPRTQRPELWKTLQHLDVNTLQHVAAKTLSVNEIGVCNLSTAVRVAFDPYADNRETGAFILIDRFSHQTLCAGMIDFALRRARNIHAQSLLVDKAARAQFNGLGPAIVWFTGLSGPGKTTIANVLERELHALSTHTPICSMAII